VIPTPTRLDGMSLFTPEPQGTALDHFLVQGREVINGSREGGFFIMIGRKPEKPWRSGSGPRP
jgi:hypothetical protein